MNRLSKVTGLALLLLFVVALPSAAQVDVSGNWTLNVQSPEGAGEVKAVLTQDGSTVTGTLEVPEIGDAEMSEGKVEESTLTFLMHISFDGQWFTIEVEADVEGDEMAGEFYMAEFGSMPFTGKRTEG